MSGESRADPLAAPVSNWRWAALTAGATMTLVVIAATLGPIESRPHLPISVNLERAIAYTAMVAAYVIARPRRWLMILSMAILMAGLLELAQLWTVSRHGSVRDVMVKMAGCGFGALLGLTAAFIADRLMSGRGKT